MDQDNNLQDALLMNYVIVIQVYTYENAKNTVTNEQ